jgi:parallel beta-helix repeat protein
VIRAGNGVNTAIFNLANDNLVLEDLRIDGNGSNQSGGNAVRINADYVTVCRCFIHDAADWGVICFEAASHAIVTGNRLYATNPSSFTPGGGVELYGAAYCSVAENIITGARSNGVYLANRTTECHHNTVSGNSITACKHAGVLAELGARDNAINGNALDANYVGIWLSNHGSPASGNVVTSNVVDASTTAGIRLDGVSECVVAQNLIGASGSSGVLVTDCRGCALTGNVARSSSRAGIYLQDTRDSVCAGNTLVSNGRSASAGNARAGIVLLQTAGACSGNVVSDNRCVDTQSTPTQQYGISVLNSASGNLLSSNLLAGNAQASRALLLSAAAVSDTYTVPYLPVSATVGTQIVAVAHGLPYTPLAITITMTSAGNIWSAQPADSRNVYLKADAAGRTATITVG